MHLVEAHDYDESFCDVKGSVGSHVYTQKL